MNLEQDTYWQEHTKLFTGTFRYFRSNGEPRPVPVLAQIHSSTEPYRIENSNSEIIPMKTLKGERIYFHIQPYVEVPDVILTIAIPPNGYADSNAIGTVQNAQGDGFRQEQIGKCQAWYYPADTTIVIWECFLNQPFREDTLLTEQTNMRQLWESIAKYFARKFPRADRIVTPCDDPLFDREEYQAFLKSPGYEPVTPAAYGKVL